MPLPYRAATPPLDPPDPEILAMQQYARRSRRVLHLALAGALILGAAAIPLLFYALLELQFWLFRGASLAVTAVAGCLPLFGALRAVRPVADAIVRARARMWREDLAARYDLDVARVRDLTLHV